MKTYEAWESAVGAMLCESEKVAQMQSNPAMRLTRKLFDVQAGNWEEACAIYHLRMGYAPYAPMGDAQPCPKCGSWFYPHGSGECWQCGKIA